MNNEMLQGELHLEWGSFWDSGALTPLPVHFESVADHNRQMFVLLLEECRSSMSTLISRQYQQDRYSAGSGARNQSQNTQEAHNAIDLKWQRGEVKVITSNLRDSLSSLSPSASTGLTDPRLGSLWILQVQLLPPKRSRSESELSNASSMSQGALDMVEGYRPGELLACRNPLWGNRLALGVVQGYDPDYDMLLSTPSDDSQFTTVQLLVCVDTASEPSGAETNTHPSTTLPPKEPSGWIDPPSMPLCQGTILQLAVIGNVVTSLRESQAISSLASLRPALRELILCPPGKSYTEYNSIKSQIPTVVKSFGKYKTTCPSGVSSKLWSALCLRYNKSQLQAMTSVVEEPRAIYEKYANGSAASEKTSSADGQANVIHPYPLLLLQGPPGTGKTSTIMGIISILLDVGVPSDAPLQQGKKINVGSSLASVASKNNVVKKATPADSAPFAADKTRILLCAPSNTAVDELVYRLKKYGILGRDGRAKRSLTVVRIGQPLNSTQATSSTEGTAIDVREFTLDYLVDKKRREIESSQQSGYRRSRIPGTVQLRHLVLEQADIVCCTLSGSGSPQLLEAIINNGATDKSAGVTSGGGSTSTGDGSATLTPFRFDVVIIDEAAQAVEPSALIPLKYNPKVLIMVGDACQLRATVLSKDATKCNFGRSLFERFDLAGFPKQMLLTQYRMHPDIASFPSKRFYEGKLSNDAGMIPTRKNKGSHWKPFHSDTSRRFRPMVFHDVWQGREELSGSSFCNRTEAEYIVDLFGTLRRQYPNSCPGGVGIITGYKAQKQLLRQLFKQRFGHNWSMGGQSGKRVGDDVEISTVDGFQGREKDVIIFSCVRSSAVQPQNFKDRSNIGFMNDSQRLNVALTRAKYGLWIVGNMGTMASSGRESKSIWRDLVEHCRKRGLMYDPNHRNY